MIGLIIGGCLVLMGAIMAGTMEQALPGVVVAVLGLVGMAIGLVIGTGGAGEARMRKRGMTARQRRQEAEGTGRRRRGEGGGTGRQSRQTTTRARRRA